MNISQVEQDLQQLLPDGTVRSREMLKTYVFTQIGGIADILAVPASYEEIQIVVTYARERNIPLTVLGNGSNVIIRDGGIRGIVLYTSVLDKMTIQNGLLVAQCGAKIIDASAYALEQELTGLEFACGIPGTVGGALYMNAGAYGGEVKDVLHSALAVNKEGQLVTLQGEELQFGYRHSIFAGGDYIVLEARFALQPGDPAAIKAKMDELTYLRESKQPLEYPSCGSVFKRPPGRFAGQLIQESGLQGVRIGGAEVSRKHAGFIVNADNATANDYIGLIHHVRAAVKDKFGVELETEVRIIGED
ncbi:MULTISPECIES: UDP-N-acetylmuramate dehydrogenase [unclassified Paenibacillus]|uniref:UDP-N-acetylmuramate dehydrogenase n=1 Tax=unclassified Paenibacillus TaxID=185978 RepID=UPI0024076532|nr:MULTISPECIES: UDP-N-acetylmuramate dehydrogenase [unclassified Paenibacillus]MDF9841176.1 UDP-N-acetylmuramate dehydrogenase [Paenibacillus sp. PastF-2]MDF9847652.1 UDP-N-acetylmuramate dehydrogenase [Paenibacillus sp. PastM-2]MDF9854221.1 UDP-N-acetylmuramate dehydrogenase [Paenibacillus sp. PastF-1]MDH6479608.1 UDP-N-acetylmuramate dehydrogenase [Paenibacillus sp. PastH-2]MDH6505273.1 UDP-N-acetylmuramate dehydrogenase [Paenibacillus sp. PastM-3]